MLKTTFAIGLFFCAAGCMPAPAEYTAEFDCGGRAVSIAGDSDEVRMTAGGKTYDLRRAVSASGARYEAKDDPKTVYWNKGDEAMVTVAGEDYPECHSATP